MIACAVATFMLGAGVHGTPEQKARLEKAGLLLPEGTNVIVSGHASGSAFTVTVTGIAMPFVQPFTIGDIEKAIALLEKLAAELGE